LEEVAERVCHKVFVEFDDRTSLIVADSHGILDQQLRPHPISLLNIVIIILINQIILYTS
jgi:hypothetical protein